MRRFSLGLFAAAALAGATACSDDDGDANVASELIYVSGSGQSGPAGTLAPQPLVVEVVTASGAPVEGVELRWDVEGGGQLNDATTNTGADGRSSVLYTLGPTAGAQSVQVSAPGLDIGDVVFSFTATDDGGGGGGGGGGEL